jgi:hypothetical protein
MTLTKIDMGGLIDACRRFAATEFGVSVDAREIEEEVMPILYQPKDLLKAVERGHLTRAELSKLVADYVYGLLMWKTSRPWGPTLPESSLNRLVSDIDAALFGETTSQA